MCYVLRCVQCVVRGRAMLLLSLEIYHVLTVYVVVQKAVSSDTSPTAVVRGRRDSGCYLSNENVNNNSSNSSTGEKKSSELSKLALVPSTASNVASELSKLALVPSTGSIPAHSQPAAPGVEPELKGNPQSKLANESVKMVDEEQVLEKVKRQMVVEGIDLTAHPYTDQVSGHVQSFDLVKSYEFKRMGKCVRAYVHVYMCVLFLTI